MFQNGSPALTSPSSARTFLTRRLADELRRELQVDARTELLHKALLYAIQRDKVNALETLLLHSAEVQMCACELACVPMRVPACLPFSSSADKALDVACKSDSGERGRSGHSRTDREMGMRLFCHQVDRFFVGQQYCFLKHEENLVDFSKVGEKE